MLSLKGTGSKKPTFHEIQVPHSLIHTLHLALGQPSKVFIALFQNHILHTLSSGEQSREPLAYTENLHGHHHHPDVSAAKGWICPYISSSSSPAQTHQFASCCLDKVLFSGTSSAPHAGCQWSRPAPHVTLHLHLKLTRLFHLYQHCFTPLPPINTTEMSSSTDKTESKHDRSTAF